MNNHVIPTFEQDAARIDTVLSDNGREFCGRPDRHPYELFLQLEDIEHRTTRVKRPQSNGIVERLHRTLLDLRVDIDPPETQAARDLMVSIERGDVSGMSIGFVARRQEWDDSREPPLRTIYEAELLDVSAVTFPAYPTTEVGLRSLESIRAAKQPDAEAAP